MACDTVCDYTLLEGASTMMALVGWIGLALIAGSLALMMVVWALAWSHSQRDQEAESR